MSFLIQTGDGNLPTLSEGEAKKDRALQRARQHLADHPEAVGEIHVTAMPSHDTLLTVFRTEAGGGVTEEGPEAR